MGYHMRTVALGLAAMLVIAACTAATDDPTASDSQSSTTSSSSVATSTSRSTTTTSTSPATTTTTLPPNVVGVDWTDQELDLPDGFRFYDITEALDRLWIVGAVGRVPMLLVSSDGEEWETVDPGWGEQVLAFVENVGTAETPVLLSGTDRDLTLVAFFGFSEGSTSPDDGRIGDLWIYTNDGSAWTARAPEETGLDVMPSGARNFRIKGFSGITRDGDSIVLVGSAQWWKPYATSDESFVSIASLPDGQWKIFGEDSERFGGQDWQTPTGVTTLDGLFVSAGTIVRLGEDAPRPFATWVSDDGVAWEADEEASAPDGLDSVVVSITSTPAGVLAAGYEEPPPFPVVENETRIRKPVVWFAPDGDNWTRVVLDEETGQADTIFTVDDTFYVVGKVDFFRKVWASTDGLTFEVIDADVPPFKGDQSTTDWRDGLAGVVLSQLHLSLP